MALGILQNHPSQMLYTVEEMLEMLRMAHAQFYDQVNAGRRRHLLSP
jgi:hypothetical protein